MNNNMNGFMYPDMNLFNDMIMQNGLMNPNMLNNQNNNNNNNVNINNNNINNMDNNDTTSDEDLARVYDGFIRGNMFENLYQQYKDYKPARLIPNNEQAELLLNVDQLTFAAHEIKLYLDVYPDDKNMINLYNQFQRQANDAIMSYEDKYGPILANTLSDSNTFSWQAYDWPWEMEEM